MGIAELRAVLAAGFESVQIAVIPPAVDEVTVGDFKAQPVKRHKSIICYRFKRGRYTLQNGYGRYYYTG